MGTLANSEDPDEMQHTGSALLAKIKIILRDRKIVIWKILPVTP